MGVVMIKSPNPNGCKYCGIDERGHWNRWSESAKDDNYTEDYVTAYGDVITSQGGWHTWVQPTQEQIKQRMIARRSENQRTD